jgi:hypothetical protein
VIESKIWKLIMDEANAQPQRNQLSIILQAANDVFDISAARNAAYEYHVPESVLFMLFASALAAALMIGTRFGVSENRSHLAGLLFVLMLSIVVFAIFDLDRPRRGMIRVSQVKMEQLLQDLGSD